MRAWAAAVLFLCLSGCTCDTTRQYELIAENDRLMATVEQLHQVITQMKVDATINRRQLAHIRESESQNAVKAATRQQPVLGESSGSLLSLTPVHINSIVPGMRILLLGGGRGKICGTRSWTRGRGQVRCIVSKYADFFFGFNVTDAGDGKIALGVPYAGETKYCTDRGNRMHCDADRIDAWEKFTLESAGDTKVALKGGKYGKYCSDYGWRGIRCKSSRIRSQEKFTVVKYGTTGASGSLDEALLQRRTESANTFADGWFGSSEGHTKPSSTEDIAWCEQNQNSTMHVETEKATFGTVDSPTGHGTVLTIAGFKARR